MSRPTVAPNEENASLAELDEAIRNAVSNSSKIRLRVIKALYLKATRDFVCQLFSICQRTLRRYVAAFNRQGIDGLIDRTHGGRPRIIQEEQNQHFEAVLTAPLEHNRHHWTARAFHGWLREEAGVAIAYSTTVRWMHDRGWRLKVPQPWPDRGNPAKRTAFASRLETWRDNPGIELWFADESGFEGEGKRRRRWAKKGTRPRLTHNGEHVRMNVAGMVCPRTGEAFCLEFTHMDREVFAVFLREANAALAASLNNGRKHLLVLDNASWHKSKKLDWGRFTPRYLPPYSPDLNPIERFWLLIKQEKFRDFSTCDRDELIEHLDEALLWAMNRGKANCKTCSIRTKV